MQPTSSGSLQQTSQKQISTGYSVPLDYVIIAVVFFALGIYVAYKLMRDTGNVKIIR